MNLNFENFELGFLKLDFENKNLNFINWKFVIWNYKLRDLNFEIKALEI